MNKELNMQFGDLSLMGNRELLMAIEVLKSYATKGVPDNFLNENVALGFNPNSGYVFLYNDNAETLMLTNGKLEKWYYLPDSGKEGFIDDLYEDFKQGFIDELDDLDFLREYLDENDMTEKAQEVRNKIKELEND